MVHTIIFDFGNVIGFFDHRRTLDRLAPFSDLLPEEIYQRVYQGDLGEPFDAGRMTVPEFLQRCRDLGPLRCDDTFLQNAIGDIFWPNPEICTLVPRLKERYRLLLGSNTNPIHGGQFQRQFADTLAHFDELVLSYRVGARKPQAAFFERCLQLADCPAEECLFIDDMPENIVGARACGMQGIVYIPHSKLTPQLRTLGIRL